MNHDRTGATGGRISAGACVGAASPPVAYPRTPKRSRSVAGEACIAPVVADKRTTGSLMLVGRPEPIALGES
jgi:hypothetical protein